MDYICNTRYIVAHWNYYTSNIWRINTPLIDNRIDNTNNQSCFSKKTGYLNVTQQHAVDTACCCVLLIRILLIFAVFRHRISPGSSSCR